MIKRVKATKVGDVFEVKISDTEKKYMQYIASDLSQLNSDVIRCFKKKYKIGEHPMLEEIVSDEVEFYAHCDSRHGIRLNLWTLYGNIQDVGDLNKPLFRETNDDGDVISENWYVWHIGEDYLHVGKLKGENRNADIGIVASAKSMYEWIKHGKYQGVRPRFE